MWLYNKYSTSELLSFVVFWCLRCKCYFGSIYGCVPCWCICQPGSPRALGVGFCSGMTRNEALSSYSPGNGTRRFIINPSNFLLFQSKLSFFPPKYDHARSNLRLSISIQIRECYGAFPSGSKKQLWRLPPKRVPGTVHLLSSLKSPRHFDKTSPGLVGFLLGVGRCEVACRYTNTLRRFPGSQPISPWPEGCF